MRELTAFEIADVSGAGWLQNSFASLGSSIGASAWTMTSDMLGNIQLPLVGNVNLASLAPELGTQVGKMIGTTIGFTLEGAIAGIPVVGGLLNKLLGN